MQVCAPATDELKVIPLGFPCNATGPDDVPPTPEHAVVTETALVVFQIGDVPDMVATGLRLLKLAVIVGGGFGSVNE